MDTFTQYTQFQKQAASLRGLLDIELAMDELRKVIKDNNYVQTYQKILDFVPLCLENAVLIGLASSTRGTDHVNAIFKECDKFFNTSAISKVSES